MVFLYISVFFIVVALAYLTRYVFAVALFLEERSEPHSLGLVAIFLALVAIWVLTLALFTKTI